MGRPPRIAATVAWVVVALLLALAPLYHAICIAPAASDVATHVMADGTVMTTPVLTMGAPDAAHAGHSGRASDVTAVDETATDAVAAAVAVTAAAPSTRLVEALTLAGPSSELGDATGVVGAIVLFAGLAVLSLAVFARRCRMLPARGIPPRRGPAAANRRDPCAWSSTDVDLHRLGISRT